VCWACNSQIDSSKPFTPIEIEDESSSKDKKTKEGKEAGKKKAK